MSVTTQRPTVIGAMHDLRRATAEQLADALEQPIEEVYAELVRLHDSGRAVIANAHHHYRRGTGRAAIWSPA